MSAFATLNIPELLGITPICLISDEQLWNELLTPQVRALLGDIKSGTTQVMETTAGLFPGDEVSNLNDHRLYGGQSGFVRFPYISSLYRTTYGAFVVKRDGLKFKVYGWFGNIDKGEAQLIFKAALRDRRYDGTKRTNDCSLLDYPYDDPFYNPPHQVNGQRIELRTVETSLYSFLPGSSIAACGDIEFDRFIEKPFTFLDSERFLPLFQRAWDLNRAPGQNAQVIPDVGKLVPKAFDKLAIQAGYDALDTAPSHYHVVKWNQANGFRHAIPAQEAVLDDLTAGIARLKAAGRKFSRQQESWICVLQNLRPIELIPQDLFIGGQVWPQDNISPANLWLIKPLSEKAHKLLGPVAGGK